MLKYQIFKLSVKIFFLDKYLLPFIVSVVFLFPSPSICSTATEHFNQGLIHSRNGEYSKAIQEYKMAIELKPDYYKAYYNRGTVYAKYEIYEKAIEDFSNAIKIKPDSYKAIFNRGEVLYRVKKYDLAIKDFNLAINLKPDLYQAFFSRGNAFREVNAPYKAIENYLSAIEVNPLYDRPYNNLSLIYSTSNDNNIRNGEKAVVYALKTLELAQNTSMTEASIFDTLATAYVANQQYQKAFESYLIVMEKDASYIEKYQRYLRQEGFYNGLITGSLNSAFKQALQIFTQQGNFFRFNEKY